jgi:hypothetical protein
VLQLFRPASGAVHVTHQLPSHLHDLHARRVGVKAASASTVQPRGVLLAVEWVNAGGIPRRDAQVSKDFEGIGAKQAV